MRYPHRHTRPLLLLTQVLSVNTTRVAHSFIQLLNCRQWRHAEPQPAAQCLALLCSPVFVCVRVWVCYKVEVLRIFDVERMEGQAHV